MLSAGRRRFYPAGGGGCRLLRRFLCVDRETPTVPDRKRSSAAHDGIPAKLLLFSPRRSRTGFLYSPTLDRRRSKMKFKLPDSVHHFPFASSQGYLFYVPNRAHPTSFLAVNPITGHRFHIPAYPSLPCEPSPVLGRDEFNVNVCSWSDSSKHAVHRRFDNNYIEIHESKAIFSPCRDIFVLLREDWPFFFRISGGNDAWTKLRVPVGLVADFFFHNGYLHAANHIGSIFVYDLNGPSPDKPVFSYLTAISYPFLQMGSFHVPMSRYFVTSPDGRDLFFVVRGTFSTFEPNYVGHLDTNPVAPIGESPFRTIDFKVFKFKSSKAGGRWRRVYDIGGLALFVGPGQTLSFSAHDFPSLLPDCIYFTDDCRRDHMFEADRVGDTGIFYVKHGKIEFYRLEDGKLKLNWPPPLWFVPTTHANAVNVSHGPSIKITEQYPWATTTVEH